LYNSNALNWQQSAAVLQARVTVYTCPADSSPDGFTPLVPASGPANGAGVAYMPGSYRGMSGAARDDQDYVDDPARASSYGIAARGVLHAAYPPYGLGAEKIPTITDGTSNTLMVGEYATRSHPSRRTVWAYTYTSYNQSSSSPQSAILLPDYDACVNAVGSSNPCKRGFASFHTGGMNFALCDGSINFISSSINMATFESLSTISGGEVIPGDY
jgi:prepilin-type processing-associated H-X9-DG protein